MIDYMTAADAAKKWNISHRRVIKLCSENRIESAAMLGNMWLIPVDSEKPIDGRTIRYEKNLKAKPFLKWAGGKSQLIDILRNHYPKGLGNTVKKYCEPMVGAGAVLFDVISNYNVDEVLINDSNAELINVYLSVRDNVTELIKLLHQFEKEHISYNNDERKDYYYSQRNLYNNLISDKKNNSILKAALFIYLNKTCFNGLYRVNKQGIFNVPMGSYKNPKICDTENLLIVSKKLQNVEIITGDYRDTEDFIDSNTFVYFDPPYKPLSKTSEFTSYTEVEFDDDKQKELAYFIKLLDKKGAHIIASNSDPKNVDENDDFFDDLYQFMTIKRVMAKRAINSKATKRGSITELLITNQKEIIMADRDFNSWLATMTDTIASWKYYTDFEKVYENVNRLKRELYLLNTLIGSENIKSEFLSLIEDYPNVLKAIPILIAKREKTIIIKDAIRDYYYSFNKMNYSIEEYMLFMENTGLFDLLSNHLVSNLYDYVTGVEVGLDTNGRKNRTGDVMEDLVESYIVSSGFVKNYNYFKEMKKSAIEEKWNVDLSKISNDGKTEKIFDFVIKTDNQIYVIETNFYASQGSKLNETARSYKNLSLEANEIQEITFVWFTDGIGWNKAKHNLEETFDVLNTIYNINDMKNGIMNEVFV